MTEQEHTTKQAFFVGVKHLPIWVLMKWSFLIIAISIPVVLIISYAQRTISAETATDGQLTRKAISASTVTKILSDIRDAKTDSAINRIRKLKNEPESDIPAEIAEYVINFLNYYDYCSGFTKTAATADYIMNHTIDMIHYLQSAGLSEGQAFVMAETIPYYSITQCELKRRKPDYAALANYSNLFLKHLSEKNGVLSQEGAIIACLKIRTAYETHRKSNDILLTIQQEIERLRDTAFPNELGENGKYSEQAAYLTRFYKHCTDLRNTGWFLSLLGVRLYKQWRFDTAIPGLS